MILVNLVCSFGIFWWFLLTISNHFDSFWCIWLLIWRKFGDLGQFLGWFPDIWWFWWLKLVILKIFGDSNPIPFVFSMISAKYFGYIRKYWWSNSTFNKFDWIELWILMHFGDFNPILFGFGPVSNDLGCCIQLKLAISVEYPTLFSDTSQLTANFGQFFLHSNRFTATLSSNQPTIGIVSISNQFITPFISLETKSSRILL